VLLILPAVLLAVCLFVQLFLLFRKQRKVRHIRADMACMETPVLEQLTVPVVLAQEDGTLFWYNKPFSESILQDAEKGQQLVQRLLRLHIYALQQQDQVVEYQNHNYQVHSIFCEAKNDVPALYALQFTDVTELLQWKQKCNSARPCVLLLVIDSYDDILQYAKESEKAQVSAEVEKVLEQFMAGTNGVIRKIENDMFYAAMETQYLRAIMQEKFKVLDEARKILVNGRIHITFSIGVGFGAETLAESEKFAHQSLDMALGRGGDQAAVKTENGFCFFGGASKGVEKKSKTRIRSVATALQELIENADQVFLMGHRFGDLDAIGSACGLAGAIAMMKKPASIVVNQKNCLAGQLIAKMKAADQPPEFIEPEEAMERMGSNSLLIILDTHNQDILESVELYKACNYVAVIDHHRKNVNFIENAVLFHHEPYASSASEMVTEIIQYFRLDGEIPAAYADALLAGIMLDTKNFVMRTGVRTFEAAAYLRKIGADTIQVKSLFSSTISMYQVRSHVVAHAEIYHKSAISALKIQSPDSRVLASQAADELLSIEGVESSFVLYPEQNNTNISARSLGGVNVQLIMEEMGGGGHQTMAAAQLVGVSLQEAKEHLLQVLESYETRK
jgi:c-di-AMP phosphodiesterase-like protein